MNDNYVNNEIYVGTGYLIVKVSTARGAIPLEGAAVTIRGAVKEDSDVIYSLHSDSDGLTEKVALSAPRRGLSEVPGNLTPYALYNIEVFKDGYIDLALPNVAIFDSITSLQGAVMIPLPDNRFPDSFVPNLDRSPSDTNSDTSGGE